MLTTEKAKAILLFCKSSAWIYYEISATMNERDDTLINSW